MKLERQAGTKVFQESKGSEVMQQNTLDAYREQLDELDGQIVELIAQRLGICQNVARFKKAEAIRMMQPDRVEIVKQKVADKARATGVDERFIRQLYSFIIEEACRLEDAIIEAK